jgi:hypothetical protein
VYDEETVLFWAEKSYFSPITITNLFMKKYLLLLVLATALFSCSEGVKTTYSIENIELTAEGPLFDGPNTMQATHSIDLSKLDSGIKPEQIESVKLTKASVTTDDSLAFNSIRNFVLQFTSSDAKMQKAGVLNPVPKNTATVELSPAAEAELGENFKQSEIIIILDADLEGDRDENLTYTGNFEFEITYKK